MLALQTSWNLPVESTEMCQFPLVSSALRSIFSIDVYEIIVLSELAQIDDSRLTVHTILKYDLAEFLTRGEKVPVFSVNMKHSVESCPMFNENIRQKFKTLVGRQEEVAKKYDIKVLSAYTSTLEHLVFYIIEAPSQQAIESYFTEIGFAFWNDIEIRQVKTVEEVVKRVTTM